MPIPKGYSDDLKNLVELLLKKDPNLRPSIDDIFELDCVKEKLGKFNLSFSSQDSNDLSSINISVNNANSNTTTQTSPLSTGMLNSLSSGSMSTNGSTNEAKLNLFNLGYGNLLNIDEVEEEQSSSSFANSPKCTQPSSTKSITKQTALNPGYPKIQAQRTHKYAPTYAVNDMNEIMKHLNIPMVNDNSDYNDNTHLNEDQQWEENVIVVNMSKFSKNQNSLPELNRKAYMMINSDSPGKLSMEEKIKRIRQRNKSINIDKPHKMHYVNQSMHSHHVNKTPEPRKDKLRSTMANHTGSANKLKQYKDLSVKKKGPKQLSLNFTSIQSPEHKTVFYEESQDSQSEFKLTVHPVNGRVQGSKDLSPKKNFNTDPNVTNFSPSNSGNNYPSPSKSTNVVLNFLVEQFGESNVNRLIQLVEQSQNPIDLLNGDGRQIQEIVGDKFKIAQNFLKKMIASSDLRGSK